MPNIEIHGWSRKYGMAGETTHHNLIEESRLKNAAIKILKRFPFAKDVIITVHDSYCHNLEGKRVPFLRICDTDTSRADDIAEALMPLKIDIEIMQLYAFYPASEFSKTA